MLLAAAIIALACLSFVPLYQSPVVAFAANGALHAATLIASLRTSTSVMRKLLLVALAAGLSIMTLYVGIIALVVLSVLPDNQRLPAVVGIGAMTGAITYGSLVRIFWIRGIKPRDVLGMAAVCAAATLIGYFLKVTFDGSGMWWLAAIWWLAFSIALSVFDTRATHVLRTHADTDQARRPLP